MRSKSALAVTLLFVLSIAGFGQTPRQAIIPSAQGGGSGNSTVSGRGTGAVAGMSDDPIEAGEILHVNVFNAPDFSLNTRVSESGEIAVPLIGPIHVAGLSTADIGKLVANELKSHSLLVDPDVTVSVEQGATDLTVLGEVRSPGIFPLPGKHRLSDVLAAAGGLTSNTGRVIEISNNRNPQSKVYVPWDPTMHNTESYDRYVKPGDRVLVRACGIAYLGGNVAKPGAYSLCGSAKMTLSEVLSLAGGILPLSSEKHTVIVRPRPDGSRVTIEVDAHRVLRARAPDMIVQEDDVIYVPASGVKNFVNRAITFSLTLVAPLFYIYH